MMKKSNLPACLALGVAAAILTITSAPSAHAGGVHDIALTSIPQARTPIVIDGNLSDWPDTHAANFAPLDPGLAKTGTAAMAHLQTHPDSATLQAAYDNKALYFGIVWTGLPRGERAGSIELNIDTDRMAHVKIANLGAGRQPVIEETVDGGGSWRNIAESGAASVMTQASDGSKTQEIRIPWSLLSTTGAPVPAIGIAVDFAWPDLTTSFLRELPTQVRHDNTHLTDCFLTSPAKLFGRDVSLGDPHDWGTLTFADGPKANATQLSAFRSGATQTYVSRISGPLTVDGSLAGWDPAQFQDAVYAPGYLGDRYSAKIGTAYDASFLYIGAHVKADGGPLNTEPEATQAGYAGGDCLQIRLNDGSHTVNLCAWYDSTNGKPALTADGNDLKNPFLLTEGAKEAFHDDVDGGGYTQVIAIPWSVLPSGSAPNVGDSWKGTFQVWWAGLNPQFTAVLEPTLAQGGGIAYTYNLPSESNVTVAVFDTDGHLVRTLAKDAHRRMGRNTEYWDGINQFGNPVTSGKYVVKGLYHPPIETEPVISIGNPGTPPWPIADGKGDWLSDEAAPQAAVTDGTNVYLAAPGCEKGSSIIAVGPDGKRIWGVGVSENPRCVSITLAGNDLYALYSGPLNVHPSAETGGKDKVERAFVICLDKTTGAPDLFSKQKMDFQVLTWPFVDKVAGLWDLRSNHAFTPANYEGQTRYFANDVGEPSDAVGIAAINGKLYLSMLSENEIVVLDATTAAQVDSIPINQPVGLRPLPNGQILGISDGKVVTIDPASKTVTTLIGHDLVAPHDVTTDKNGNIYVSDWATSFQVKVFSPTGAFVRAIGTPGGRPWIGKWDQNGMLLPRGMAVTDDGKLWVAEDDASPNRVSVWNAADGSFIRDYLGPSPYGGGSFFWADPTNISTVVAGGVLYHVDYLKKTWTPVSTPFRRLSEDTPFTPNGMVGGTPGSRTITHNGVQYVYFSAGEFDLTVLRRDGDRFTPVAAIGCRSRLITTDGTQRDIWDSDIGTHRIQGWYPPFFAGHTGDNFIWTDKNGDGIVQPDEIQWVNALARWDKPDASRMLEINCGWGFGIGPDGSVYLNGQLNENRVQTITRLDLEGWTPSGAPMYDLNHFHTLVSGQIAGGNQGLFVDDQNHLLVTHGYEWNPGIHNALDCYTRDGKLLWTMHAPEGRQQPDDLLADNVLNDFTEPGGEHVLGTWLWHGNFKPYLFTPDGLYVSSLLDDTRVGPTATWDESYKQYFQAPDGSDYIVDGVNDAYHIDKITGLDQIHRFNGAVTVSDADLKAAAVARAQALAAPPPVQQPLVHVTWADTAPTIDGDLGDWNMGTGVSLKGTKGRNAQITLRRDATNLYLAYDVQGAKLVNKGSNWQTMFISGDCDDLMLHVGSDYKPHFGAEEGDERLLLTLFQGKPLAVLYRPVVDGATTSTRLMATDIDEIIKLPSANIAYKRTDNGYTLEASVPLSDLGIDPAQKAIVKGDVGVIYADETGSDRALRLYYYNQDTNMTADLSTEARLQPGNWGDILFPLGPNLIKNGDFEEPLATDPTQGWVLADHRNGTGQISGDIALTGEHSLLLEETDPVVFPAAEFTDPDYGKFINSANGGKGGAYVVVWQRVPVQGGHDYTFRFRIHTVDFRGGEEKNTIATRGYDSAGLGIDFRPVNQGIWGLNYQDSNPGWVELYDPRFNQGSVPVDYHAPDGTQYVDIHFSLAGNSAANMPKEYIDDVELTESK